MCSVVEFLRAVLNYVPLKVVPLFLHHLIYTFKLVVAFHFDIRKDKFDIRCRKKDVVIFLAYLTNLGYSSQFRKNINVADGLGIPLLTSAELGQYNRVELVQNGLPFHYNTVIVCLLLVLTID